ncbi:hypothetical protein M422DRAFT_168269 [Sphaerobolus stellatus SS14]|uniref:Uncharacterized protein n=1 Tax=Sphaerobolus stellatus (strain SS14) TaxID=990650 RepID=A0A0C9W043_SPHS4|nr:hypothetical protein M422DRAFT_168269 [Sphaerobolus stellatus SS14]
MSNQHPLVLELNSLRAAFEQYQAGHAAHVSSIQLQRARLEASEASAQARILEAENDRLKREVTYLRENVEPSQTSRQVTELSLALRRVSDKISLIEDALLKKTTELTHCISDKHKLKVELKAALSSLEAIRRTQDEAAFREIELERRCKAAEEETHMTDLVIMEYADLVRSLEQKLATKQTPDAAAETSDDIVLHTNGSANGLIAEVPLKSLTENRASLQRLLHEFNAESGRLQEELSRLHGEISNLQSTLEAERTVAASDRETLAQTLLQLELSRVDDAAASRIVARYMKFSQSSIDTLQTALETVKARHNATMTTLSTSAETLSSTLELERKRAARLRDAMDQLTEDVSRETFGRRREVALKLRCLVREEMTFETLRAWIRRAEESRSKLTEDRSVSSDHLLSILDRMLEDARNVLVSLTVEGDSFKTESWGRIVLAEQTCTSLMAELSRETESRLHFAKLVTLDAKSPPTKEIAPPNLEPSGRASQDSTSDPEITSNNHSHGQVTPDSEVISPAQTYINDSDQLKYISQRYEPLQKSFRDCHLSLSSLKDRVASDMSHGRRIALIQNVVLRLDDFCEDARVELDIRTSDEERMAERFKAILSLAQPFGTRITKTQEEYESFKDGTMTSVVKTREALEGKLSDLQHDIAQVKRALDEDETEPETPASSVRSPGWTSWTQPFLGSSSGSPPPAPTFGAVITSPKLRRTGSNASILSTSSHTVGRTAHDPYAHLDLRISMPSHFSFQRLPNTFSWHPSPIKPKSRSTSAMYLLGLGASGSGTQLSNSQVALSDYESVDANQSDIE